MLSSIRSEEACYPVPQFNLTAENVEEFKEELKGFHEQFEDCFYRSESRAHFFNYMVGQFASIERKSIEPIALALDGGNIRAMQRFVSDAPWDDDKIARKFRNLVNEDLGRPDGALIFDESSFVKKGDNSIGVARQYCGSLGKVDNCQVGVFAGYVSELGYTLVDKRLFLPEQWFDESHAERRIKCKLPEEVTFKTKPQLAAEMLASLRAENVLPFKYILADSLYGMSPDFISAAEALPDATYLVQASKSTQVWLKHPMNVTREYRWGGKKKSKSEKIDSKSGPIRVDKLAANINNYYWYRRKVSEGTKGPVMYEYTRRRVIISVKGLPQKSVWLLIRRTLGKTPEYSYFICNAQRSVRFGLLIWLSGLRWAIEQSFEEAKSELGMDHYEVRKYTGWHHHMLTCMMAHFFLWHLKIRLGKKSTFHYFVAA
jgi:SRSO17 transposase